LPNIDERPANLEPTRKFSSPSEDASIITVLRKEEGGFYGFFYDLMIAIQMNMQLTLMEGSDENRNQNRLQKDDP